MTSHARRVSPSEKKQEQIVMKRNRSEKNSELRWTMSIMQINLVEIACANVRKISAWDLNECSVSYANTMCVKGESE